MLNVKSLIRAAGFAAVLGLGAWTASTVFAPAYEGNAGIAYGTGYAPVRGVELDFHIWYPATPGGRATTVGGNGAFQGTQGGYGAPHQPGKHPLIMISHGGGGNAGQFGWIASRLAEKGYVVVLPNHPGSTSGNASAHEVVKVWKRPADISAVLDEITGNPENYPYIDTETVVALGFSAGGYTAMALSGGIVDPQRLQTFCDDGLTGMSDCEFLRLGGVDLHEEDLSPAAQDHHDPRIQAAVIVDPGIISTLTEESLAQIDIPMLVVNLGPEGGIPRGVFAKPAADLIAGSEYTTVPDAVHFSFLAECTARGPKILEREGELDALCEDAGGRTRPELHDAFTQIITEYLERTLAEQTGLGPVDEAVAPAPLG